MKIKSIELNNFKFHKNLNFDINKENCLIYGENGTGKSSIYWGLYSIFKKSLIDIDEYKTYGSTSSPKVNIALDDNPTTLLKTDVISLLINKNSNTIYFAHQDFLEEITSKENFYKIIEKSLKNFFPSLNNYIEEFIRINNDINETNNEEEASKRQINIQKFKVLLNQLELRANDIINHHFDEIFYISFDVDWGMSQLGVSQKYTFSQPKIIIKIDNRKDLKLNFNEAKLKLVSIAIFFALIKLEESNDNQFKLLVLDDFLTSLDMANRKLIVQYILDNFKEYQKIILTHNIQFYNLIIKFLNMRDEEENWDIKNIFLINESNENIALIKDSSEQYLNNAKKELLKGEFHVSGNYSRKEFERIVSEFKQVLEIGKQEQLNHILEILKSTNSENKFYKKPFFVLNKLNSRYRNISDILDSNDNNSAKIGQIKYEIKQIKEFLKTEECELLYLKELLSKTEFYKNILFNPASHSNGEIEIYRKECIGSIRLLEKLNKILKSLK